MISAVLIDKHRVGACVAFQRGGKSEGDNKKKGWRANCEADRTKQVCCFHFITLLAGLFCWVEFVHSPWAISRMSPSLEAQLSTCFSAMKSLQLFISYNTE